MFPCCIYSHIFSTYLKEARQKTYFQTFWRNCKWCAVQRFFWVVAGRVNYGCLTPAINVCWDFFTSFIIQWVKITPDLKDSLKRVLLRRLLSVDGFDFVYRYSEEEIRQKVGTFRQMLMEKEGVITREGLHPRPPWVNHTWCLSDHQSALILFSTRNWI